MCVVFLVLGHMCAQGLLDFSVHKLHKICTLGSLLIDLGPTGTPKILDWSAFLVKAMTIKHVVALEWPPMLFA